MLIARSDQEERVLLEQLERGTISATAFSTLLAEVTAQRAEATALLAQTDGYRFLGELWRLRQRDQDHRHPAVAELLAAQTRTRSPPAPATTVQLWIPLPLLIAGMSVPDRRRLLRAAVASVILREVPLLPEVVAREVVAAYGPLRHTLSRFLASGGGIPVPA